MTDSSTVAMPSMTSPSPGIRSPASHSTTSPARSAERGDLLDLARLASSRLRERVGLGLAQAVGLGLAARFRHGFGEVREQHREPQPQGDLQREADAAGAGEDVADQEHGGERRAHFDHEHHRILQQRDRVQFARTTRASPRPTISGSNSGRERASFLGSSDVGSSCGPFGRGFGFADQSSTWLSSRAAAGSSRTACRYASGNAPRSAPAKAPGNRSARRRSARCRPAGRQTAGRAWGRCRS